MTASVSAAVTAGPPPAVPPRRLDPAGDLAEGDPAAAHRRCGRRDRDDVAVLEEGAGRAVGEGERLLRRPRTAPGTSRAGPRSGPLTVPDANRSPVRSVAPLTVMWASCWAGVQYIVGERRPADQLAVEPDLEREVEAPRVGVGVVAGRAAAAGRAPAAATRAASSAASGTTHAETEVANDLPRNGPERHVLPGLDVAGRPVVEQHDAEHVVGEGVERHRAPSADGDADDEARPRPRCRAAATGRTSAPSSRGLALTAGTHDVGAGDDHRAGPAVVADRQVLPVRRQRLGVRAGRCGRRSRRGAPRSRSRRSRPPRTAGAG